MNQLEGLNDSATLLLKNKMKVSRGRSFTNLWIQLLPWNVWFWKINLYCFKSCFCVTILHKHLDGGLVWQLFISDFFSLEMWQGRMRAFITVKHPTRTRLSNQSRPSSSQLVPYLPMLRPNVSKFFCKSLHTWSAVFAEMGWTFVQEPTNMTVKRGENLTLTCSPPHSRPEARVTWFRNDQLLFPTGHITALPNGDLFFLR